MASIWEKLSLDQLIAQGFPESTARKIKSGELPMDVESRMARAREQGFDTNVDWFHGTPYAQRIADEGFDPSVLGRGNDQMGAGFYFTDEPYQASGYATNLQARALPEATPGVIPVLLRAQNPNIIDIDAPAGMGIELTADMAADIMKRSPSLRSDEGPLSNFIEASSLDGYTDADIEQIAAMYAGRDADILMGDMFQGEGAEFLKALNEATGIDSVQTRSARPNDPTVTTVFDPSQARSPNAAFDPDNLNQPYLLGATESGSGPSLMDRATGAAATVGDIATQTWDEMSLLDKAALVTSPLPFIGAGTGIAADVMNMVNNPEERTFLNAALLASNFIPGNKIAGAGMAMVDASKKGMTRIVDTFTNVPDAAKPGLIDRMSEIDTRIKFLEGKDDSLRSPSQKRDTRYRPGANLSESELAEYNELVNAKNKASVAGRTGESPDTISEILEGQAFGDLKKGGRMRQARTPDEDFAAVTKGEMPAADFDLQGRDEINGLSYEAGDFTKALEDKGLYVYDDRMGTVIAGKSKADVDALRAAQTPYDYGKAYGYSDADIAAFYSSRRGGMDEIAEKEFKQDRMRFRRGDN